jgi:hypothetical protein
VSRLRARCPDCRTFTAVAIGPGYECHAVRARVRRRHGARARRPGARAASRWPRPRACRCPSGGGRLEEETLDEQTLAVAIDLPERPLVLGGCCCAHIGAVEASAARNGRIALSGSTRTAT